MKKINKFICSAFLAAAVIATPAAFAQQGGQGRSSQGKDPSREMTQIMQELEGMGANHTATQGNGMHRMHKQKQDGGYVDITITEIDREEPESLGNGGPERRPSYQDRGGAMRGMQDMK